MSDLKASLRYLADRGSPVGSDRLRERVAVELAGQATRQTTRMIPGWAIAVAAAAVVFVVIGVTTMLLGGSDSPVASLPPAQSTASTPAVTTMTETPVRVEEWSPILSETVAGVPPLAATCPEGDSPDESGPADQSRPWGATWSNQAAVFDQHAGQIIFLDETGDTWIFDVCTNTWQQMNPRLVPDDPSAWPDPNGWSGALVYDVDSDVTVSFARDYLAIYNTTTNTWTQRSQPVEYDTGVPGSGAVYDPQSGLVVVQTQTSGLVAYDVDTDTWTQIGNVEENEYPSYLIGYLVETDQLAFLGGFDDRGMIIDPRSGKISELKAPGDGVFAGFGRLNYSTSTNTAYVLEDTICRLEPTTSEWDCLSLAEGPGTLGNGAGLLSAIVGDPINNRIVLINGYGPGFGESFYEVNDIWAIDFDTAEWTQLLTRTG